MDELSSAKRNGEKVRMVACCTQSNRYRDDNSPSVQMDPSLDSI